jgi:metal-sulfur cluster biosynthetic enzyme
MRDGNAARAAEVWERLGRVTDPELDEPVTELGFVTDVTVASDGAVGIGFRLPTYWCAANFAFMMADDMRAAAAALPWVTRVDLAIDAHMYGDEINRAMQGGLSFQDAFPTEADGNLAEVRRTFLLKSFQRRQEALLRALLAAGADPARFLAHDEAGLRADHAADPALVARYLERRPLVGSGPRAFVTVGGAPIAPGTLTAYLRDLRRVTINTEFNGALCRGLLAARYDEADATLPPEPTLVDFIRQHRAGGPASI